MSLPQIPKVDREQALTDLVEALALQEAALASMIAAEAAKVDALVYAGIPAAASTKDVESYQAAVAAVLQITAQKAQALNSNLQLLRTLLTEKAD